MKVNDRITCPGTGKRGKVVFISPVTKRIYVEFDRTLPWITYAPGQLVRGGDLFGPLHFSC